jgi:translation initiation factor IF-2
MAKKRVHEIAKEKGISSKEVLAILQNAGFDVKAAASSVEEADIARAFETGADGQTEQKAPAEDSGQAAPKRRAQQPGDGQGAPQPSSRPARGEGRPRPTRGGRAGERAPGGAGAVAW